MAYAVDEMASLAKTGRAIFLLSRWWPSSAVAMGRPMTSRLRDWNIGVAEPMSGYSADGNAVVVSRGLAASSRGGQIVHVVIVGAAGSVRRWPAT